MDQDITRLGYREIAERYDLGSVKLGGDLQLTETGDLKMTRDGDIQLGDDVHNALHRLVVRWQFNALMLKTLCDFVRDSEEKQKRYKNDLEEISKQMLTDRDAAIERWHETHLEIGVEEYVPEAYAGTVMVVLHAMLRREWADLGASEAAWRTSGTAIAGHSFGSVVEAAANNFRHSDEWAATADATAQQMRSMEVLSSVLNIALDPNGIRHPFRTNVCPEVLRVLNDGSFETLMDRFYLYARSLAGLT